ncbi:MAG: hypothetical protein QCH96_00395 [Candidatus Thermoplasmatota archaeon]|nr:hypothetical protein [Candidatus Thermoplasmatota archaeon]
MNMDIMGLDITLIHHIFYFFMTLLFSAFLLHIGTGLLGFEKKKLSRAITVVILGNIVLFALSFYPFGVLLGFVVFLYLIKRFYTVGWIKSFLAFLMSIVVAVVIALVLFIALGLSISYYL